MNFGWSKDKYDPHDYLHRRKLVTLPDTADLSNLLPVVRDQGKVGSCVGFGIGANLSGVAMTLGILSGWYSPTWLYNGARFIEGTLPLDLGCEPGDALDWCLKHGILLESFWPYDAEKLDRSAPSSERMAQADKYKGFAYYRVDNGVDGICSALAEGHLVSIGTPWFDKWRDPPEGMLPDVAESDSVAGGHETILAAYDRSKGVFNIGQNSWGTAWGKAGRYSMPFSAFDVFKKLGGYDAHYIVFTSEPAPPEPAPSCAVGNAIAGVMNLLPRAVHKVYPGTARGAFAYSYKKQL